jgi:hypothetical protein
MSELERSHTRLKDEPGEVVWAKSKNSGVDIVKEGYTSLVETKIMDKDWRWTEIWQRKTRKKTTMHMCLVLKKKNSILGISIEKRLTWS